MKSYVIAAICVAFFGVSTIDATGQCRGSKVLYEADLSGNGDDILENREGFRVDDSFVDLPQPNEDLCKRQGVLKITFPDAVISPGAATGVQKKMLKFDLTFDTQLVSGYSFHAGDSPTNQAIGGNDGTSGTFYKGEVFSKGLTWTVHTNDLPSHPQGNIAAQKQSYVTNQVTVFIGDEYVSSVNGAGTVLNLQGQYMPAALRGQGQDYIMRVGLNRLIHPQPDGTVNGAGLCRIKITACDVPSKN